MPDSYTNDHDVSRACDVMFSPLQRAICMSSSNGSRDRDEAFSCLGAEGVGGERLPFMASKYEHEQVPV